MTPRVYLQTQNAHGSWVTPTDATGARLEFDLTNDTLRQLKACPANARLVSTTTGETVVTKHTIETYRVTLRAGYEPPVKSPPKVRPVCRRNVGIPARVGKWDRTAHARSWWTSIVRA